jgi:hypothetical protein
MKRLRLNAKSTPPLVGISLRKRHDKHGPASATQHLAVLWADLHDRTQSAFVQGRSARAWTVASRLEDMGVWSGVVRAFWPRLIIDREGVWGLHNNDDLAKNGNSEFRRRCPLLRAWLIHRHSILR